MMGQQWQGGAIGETTAKVSGGVMHLNSCTLKWRFRIRSVGSVDGEAIGHLTGNTIGEGDKFYVYIIT
jgi:hypothetical protein